MTHLDEGFNKIQIYDLGRYNTHSDLGACQEGEGPWMISMTTPSHA